MFSTKFLTNAIKQVSDDINQDTLKDAKLQIRQHTILYTYNK